MLDVKNIMQERFGKDTVLALATVENGLPFVRNVNAFYEDGKFYIITYALSNKMQQIEKDAHVAIAGEWFTGQGVGENLGYIYNPENAPIACKLKVAFLQWYENGHNDYTDHNTCILCVHIQQGVLFSQGKRYELSF